MEWVSVKDKQPPKDGTPFLCYDPKQTESWPKAKIYVVCFEEETNLRDGGYVEAGGECYFTWNPTHWMPLPKTPKD